MNKVLNKKLAEWAGFKEDKQWNDTRHWVTTSGQHLALPDFASSLNALFKWIVPKIIFMDGFCLLSYQYIGFAREIKLLRHSWSIHFDDEKDNSYASAETSALALCQAVQQLIDRISQPPSGDARNLAE